MGNRLLYSLFILLALTGCRNRIAPVPAGDASLVVSDRISNQRVNAFAEDDDGHIWIATARGLNKYTVNDYHQYFCADDTLGLPDNQVNSVFYSKKGQLWVEPRTESPSARTKAAFTGFPSWATAATPTASGRPPTAGS